MKIYVCVHGGIATDIYASKDRNGEAEAVVLDVDKERPDADAILGGVEPDCRRRQLRACAHGIPCAPR